MILEHCPPLDHPVNVACLPDGCQGFNGETVHFSCEDDRYKLTGSSSLMCLSDGTWNGSVPQCKSKKVVFQYVRCLLIIYCRKM